MAARSSALPTRALSSLEAMLHSLMRGSGGGAGGGDDDDPPIDDTLASPPPPPLPARPSPRGRRHPSRPRCRVRVQAAGPWEPSSPSPSPSTSPIEEPEDARTTEDVVEELDRKAVEVEARLREKEEENAALKRRIESYHIRWLEYEIRIKSMEEAFHEQMAAMQMAQDTARMAEETAYADGSGPSESHAETAAAEEPTPVVRLWHGRDRMSSSVGARPRGTVSRLGSEFRRQSRTLERAVETPPPGPAAPAAITADDFKKIKAQFRAWAKEYKARLRKAQAEIDRDRRRRGGSCWI